MYLNLPGTCFLKMKAPTEVPVLTELLTIGVHAVMRGGIKIGDTVVIRGSDAIGLVPLICAKMSGVCKIIVVGGPKVRLDLAQNMGADVDIDEFPSVHDRAELLKSHTNNGEGTDVVFECAGFLPTTPEGLSQVRYGSTFVEVGHFVDMGSIDFNINQLLMRKNLRLESV